MNRAIICAMTAIVCLSGCQTDRVTSDGRPLPPEPREAPVTPPDARANRMAFMVGSKPDDTDNNGFPDLIRVTVALFASPHPTAIREEGAFEFKLLPGGQSTEPDAVPIGTWRVDGESVRQAWAQAQYGPCYQFQLSLLETGGDRLALDRADLLCRFLPADAAPAVESDGVRTIQIGSRTATE